MEELNTIDVSFAHESMSHSVVTGIRDGLRGRHNGNENFTILTQAAMLSVFDEVLRIITTGVVAIAAVSLLVGAVGILTVMWISVAERTHEIGLMRALGAAMGHVRRLFLLEAVALAGIGGATGLLAALGLGNSLRLLIPGLPVSTPLPFVAIALLASKITGLLSGVAPARRAALLDPIESLRGE